MKADLSAFISAFARQIIPLILFTTLSFYAPRASAGEEPKNEGEAKKAEEGKEAPAKEEGKDKEKAAGEAKDGKKDEQKGESDPKPEFPELTDKLLRETGPLPGETRVPVPDKSDVKKAVKELRKEMKEDYDKKRPDDLLLLGRKLIDKAFETSDPVARYACFEEAVDIALDLRDTRTVMEAAEGIAEYYEVDRFEIWKEYLKNLTKKVARPEEITPVVLAYFSLAKDAYRAGKTDASEDFCKDGEKLAKKSRNDVLEDQLKDYGKGVGETKKLHSEFEKAKKKWLDNNNDQKACTSLGWYLGVIENNWEKATPLLQKSKDKKLRELADAEAKNPEDADAIYDLGMAYLALSEKERGPVAQSLEDRAMYWFNKGAKKFSLIQTSKVGPMLVTYNKRSTMAPGLITTWSSREDGSICDITYDPIDIKWGKGSPRLGIKAKDFFSVKLEGFLFIATKDVYYFKLSSDDNSKLYIDNKLVAEYVINEKTAGKKKEDLKDGQCMVTLEPGYHAIKVDLWENEGSADVKLEWHYGKNNRAVIPADLFYHDRKAAIDAEAARDTIADKQQAELAKRRKEELKRRDDLTFEWKERQDEKKREAEKKKTEEKKKAEEAKKKAEAEKKKKEAEAKKSEAKPDEQKKEAKADETKKTENK
ncbi:MAG: hypothetical protein JXR97_06120 [Planctomycetes bacterium]|nr:hypothetical protein [Planctomycetota bacterium]